MYCLLKKKRQCLFFHCSHTTTINTGFCDLKRCRAFCLPASKQAVLQQWTPGGCPLIQFSCHTIYLELALGPTGSSPQTIPHSTWLIDWLIDWLMGPEFEFRVLFLQIRHSTTWSIPPVHFALVISEMRSVNYFPRMASNHYLLDLSLSNS
jgi:hypothetical protein